MKPHGQVANYYEIYNEAGPDLRLNREQAAKLAADLRVALWPKEPREKVKPVGAVAAKKK